MNTMFQAIFARIEFELNITGVRIEEADEFCYLGYVLDCEPM